jgi:SAM domain (Sterile alpha motif)
MDLGGWLRSLGLERYEAAFRENEIDASVLHDLTEDQNPAAASGCWGYRKARPSTFAPNRQYSLCP